MRILCDAGIPYDVLEYDADEDHVLSRGAALRLSGAQGIPSEQVFKTIVMRTDKAEIVVFCESAVFEINLKKARAACGARDVNPVHPEELLPLTGYVRGGCSPIGMRRRYRTFIDETALLFDRIYISAGVRGMQLVLSPADLISITGAATCDLTL